MEEEKEDSAQEHEELGMDTNSEQLPMKMKKKKTSKNNKEIKRLKLEIKELEQKNEKLREVNWKLKVQRTRISKQAHASLNKHTDGISKRRFIKLSMKD